MAYQPVRKEKGRKRVRFEFDGDRGRIYHRDRDEVHGEEYQIAVKDGKFRLEPVKGTTPVDDA